MSLTCPSCKSGMLLPDFIDGLFRCHSCSSCDGHWIYLLDYLHWLERDDFELNGNDSTVIRDEPDTKHALICPVTGNLMLKYRISNKTSHRIDLSPSISAIWLDKGEWELIKQEGFSHHLNKIFTEPWQRQVKSDETKQTLEAMYQEKFGAVDYLKLKDVRVWLDGSDNKQAMMAYLIADAPYKA